MDRRDIIIVFLVMLLICFFIVHVPFAKGEVQAVAPDTTTPDTIRGKKKVRSNKIRYYAYYSLGEIDQICESGQSVIYNDIAEWYPDEHMIYRRKNPPHVTPTVECYCMIYDVQQGRKTFNDCLQYEGSDS